MKILFVSQYFAPEIGAPQSRLSAFAKELMALGHDVEVVTALPNYPTGSIYDDYRGHLYKCEDVNGVKVHRVWTYPALGSGWKRILGFASFAVLQPIALIRARKPDLVFVNSAPLTFAPVALVAARIWRAKAVLNISDLWPDSLVDIGTLSEGLILKVLHRFEASMYRRFDGITTVSDGIVAALQTKKGVSAKRVFMFPNGIDADLIRDAGPLEERPTELPANEHLFTYPGNIGFFSGIDVVLDAMKLLAARDDIQFVFIGDGSDRARLQKRVEDERLANVTFLAPMPLEELLRLLPHFVAGVVPLIDVPVMRGARPAKMFPILGSGRPVIYAGVGEGASLVEQASGGIVTPTGDPLALADAIRALADDRDTADRLGRQGQAFVLRELSYKSLTRKWLSALADEGLVTPE